MSFSFLKLDAIIRSQSTLATIYLYEWEGWKGLSYTNHPFLMWYDIIWYLKKYNYVAVCRNTTTSTTKVLGLYLVHSLLSPAFDFVIDIWHRWYNSHTNYPFIFFYFPCYFLFCFVFLPRKFPIFLLRSFSYLLYCAFVLLASHT